MIIMIFLNLATECPDKIKRIPRRRATYKDKCLVFVNTEVTWEEVSSTCQTWGTGISGNLVTIPDNETLNIIISILDNSGRPDVWIGLSRTLGVGWKWVTGISFHS